MTDLPSSDPAAPIAAAPDPGPQPGGARDLLRQKPYMTFLASRFSGNLAGSVQSVALGW